MRTRHIVAALFLAVGGIVALGGTSAAWASASAQEEGKVSHEAEECIEKLEDGGEPVDCHEAPSPIVPATKELVWGGISFIVLFVLLAKVAYPPIKKAMEARTNRIRENLDDAERVKTEASTILEEYQRQLADARNESNRIIEEARQTADQLRRDLMQRAEAEVNELKQRTQDDINAARDRTMGELREQVAGLAIELAEKVVEANLDRDTNAALIERYIDQVGSQR
jgi:F-type H+-transporting ATPase subunit b